MPKVHRAYRYTWWKPKFQQAGMLASWHRGLFGISPHGVWRNDLPGRAYSRDEGESEESEWFYAEPSEGARAAQEEYRHWLHWLDEQMERVTFLSAKGFIGHEPKSGIAGTIGPDGKLYPLTEVQKEIVEQQKVQPSKEEFYREVLYQIYRSSGYSIEESINVGYTPHGKEIMRYLAKNVPVAENEDLPESSTF